MRRVLAPLTITLSILVPLASCSSKHTDRLACHTTTVASNAQPRGASPATALTWFLTHMAKSSGVPASGFTQEARNATRVVFASKDGKTRLNVNNFGTAKQPSWAVASSIRC